MTSLRCAGGPRWCDAWHLAPVYMCHARETPRITGAIIVACCVGGCNFVDFRPFWASEGVTICRARRARTRVARACVSFARFSVKSATLIHFFTPRRGRRRAAAAARRRDGRRRSSARRVRKRIESSRAAARRRGEDEPQCRAARRRASRRSRASRSGRRCSSQAGSSAASAHRLARLAHERAAEGASSALPPLPAAPDQLCSNIFATSLVSCVWSALEVRVRHAPHCEGAARRHRKTRA